MILCVLKCIKYLIGLQNSGDETWSQENFYFIQCTKTLNEGHISVENL